MLDVSIQAVQQAIHPLNDKADDCSCGEDSGYTPLPLYN